MNSYIHRREGRIIKMVTMNLRILCLLLSSVFVMSAVDPQRKAYIAYMGSLPEKDEYSPSSHHSQIINEIIDSSFVSKSLIRSYKRSFNGFAAYLSEDEQQKLANFGGILKLFPSQKFRLQTTRSWDFMGLTEGIERRPVSESDVIIGFIDSGIWPESESFNDEGLGPIPSKWKGGCYGGKNFTCNRKIIGARCYSIEATDFSARDTVGHGTHVASILAGQKVKDANFYGLARGIARGGVPAARLAAYKVCDDHCDSIDLLSAFDDAIADGVDIISISLGQDYPAELTTDPIAIGAFHAMEKGILTVNSAGNSGPSLYSVTGIAPWIFTVAAGEIDRRIIDKVLLGDGTTIVGNSINSFPSSDGLVPLVYGQEVTSGCSMMAARNCLPECLDGSKVKEKVVLCDKSDYIQGVFKAGAFGSIIPNLGGANLSHVVPLPASALRTIDLNLVKTYKQNAINPRVQIFKSEEVKNPDAPRVALFSSRGPTGFISDIVKPDIVAPGVEILAAYSPMASPTKKPLDKRSVKYIILSGTSMACPHVAAAAAFVKSFHPTWSPSAIKSALMTTAREMNPIANKDAEFAYGSGQIDPLKAKDPGLVYETFKEDYLKIWCNISQYVGSSTFANASCPVKLTPKEINYPSMAVRVDTKAAFVVTFPRTVTNVGRANSTYVASIKGVSSFRISVKPNSLQFNTLNQKMSFLVTIKGKGIMSNYTIESVSLVWTDGIYNVRSPIVVYTENTTSSGEITSISPHFHTTLVIVLVIFLL